VADDPRFVTAGRLAIRASAVVAVIAALVLSITTTAGTRHALDQYAVLDDIAGEYGVFVSDVDIDATLTRGEGGQARVEVVETLDAVVGENLRAIPQVTRAWRDQVDGHDQGLVVDAILVDGVEAPFEQSRVRGHALVQTRLADDWPGDHEIEIRYTLTDAASAVRSGDGWQDRVRWTALLPWWESSWQGIDVEPERLRVAIGMSTDLADALGPDSGWLAELAHRKDRPPVAFGVPSEVRGEAVFSFDERADDEYEPGSLWPSGQQFGGAELAFPAGTFTGPAESEWGWYTAWQLLPWLLSPLLALVVLVLSAVGALSGADRLARRGKTRDLVRWVPLALTVAQLPLLFWATVDAYSEDPLLLVMFASLGVSAVAAWVVVVKTRHTPAPVAAPPARRRRARR
jgi:hypothetical protein